MFWKKKENNKYQDKQTGKVLFLLNPIWEINGKKYGIFDDFNWSMQESKNEYGVKICIDDLIKL